MGMYTELVIKCEVYFEDKENAQQIHSILCFLFDHRDFRELEEIEKDLPNHPFFKCPRWFYLGRSNSYYHIPITFSYYHLFATNGKIFSRSDLKNYDNEIELFLDWLKPYIDANPNEIIGWTQYEGCPIKPFTLDDLGKIDKSEDKKIK